LYHAWPAGLDVWLKPDDSDDYADDAEHAGDGSEGDISTFPPGFHPNMAKSGNKTMDKLGFIFVKRIVV